MAILSHREKVKEKGILEIDKVDMLIGTKNKDLFIVFINSKIKNLEFIKIEFSNGLSRFIKNKELIVSGGKGKDVSFEGSI